MFLEQPKLRVGATEPLTADDLKQIELLYACGHGGGISFSPFQLETGFFRGIRHDGDLVAMAGVQVVSHHESVAAVGNVFTRPDCRGQGLAQIVTSAVVAALLDAGIRTIGLNVERTNTAAIRAYEAIGLRSHLNYYEGVADRLPQS
jgi:ribosomal protein S18 acetylase RimI-like enzyme